MAPTPLELPAHGPPTAEWCRKLETSLQEATLSPAALAQVLPASALLRLIEESTRQLKAEKTLVEVSPSALNVSTATVVGDTHGQYHDVARMFELFGHPSTERMYIFNGDYVDRGAWGVELLTLLCAYKWALPKHFYMLRGNHESTLCARMYGFRGELQAKYGKAAAQLFSAFKRLFAALPLAALVEKATLILHGGLFRHVPKPVKPNKKAKKRGRSKADDDDWLPSASHALVIGTLDDLRACSKGGQDPDGMGSTVLATDVLWSDPMVESGMKENTERGVGTRFGPDVTEAFMKANNVRLIIRSHEGPDARFKREDLGSMDNGYTIDHITPCGKLMTVFSAPDYPQFQEVPDAERFNNKAAVAVLSAPGFAEADMRMFEAVLPRPHAQPYYDLSLGASSEEEEEDEQGQASTATAASAGSLLEDDATGSSKQQQPAQASTAAEAAADGVADSAAAQPCEAPCPSGLPAAVADAAAKPGDAKGMSGQPKQDTDGSVQAASSSGALPSSPTVPAEAPSAAQASAAGMELGTLASQSPSSPPHKRRKTAEGDTVSNAGIDTIDGPAGSPAAIGQASAAPIAVSVAQSAPTSEMVAAAAEEREAMAARTPQQEDAQHTDSLHAAAGIMSS